MAPPRPKNAPPPPPKSGYTSLPVDANTPGTVKKRSLLCYVLLTLSILILFFATFVGIVLLFPNLRISKWVRDKTMSSEDDLTSTYLEKFSAEQHLNITEFDIEKGDFASALHHARAAQNAAVRDNETLQSELLLRILRSYAHIYKFGNEEVFMKNFSAATSLDCQLVVNTHIDNFTSAEKDIKSVCEIARFDSSVEKSQNFHDRCSQLQSYIAFVKSVLTSYPWQSEVENSMEEGDKKPKAVKCLSDEKWNEKYGNEIASRSSKIWPREHVASIWNTIESKIVNLLPWRNS